MVIAMTKYHNPILSGFYPDPSICRVGNTFYMVTSSFEYFPSVPIFKSENLVNWTQIGHCITQENYLKLEHCRNSGGIYAPTLRYHNGVFYMITTDISGIRNFFVTATDPAGPWSRPVLVDLPGIDPSIYFEDDKMFCSSTSKMVNGKQHIVIAQVDPVTGECLTPQYQLWEGTGGRFPEGAHLYKKDGWYYLLLAEGGTAMGHMVTMARSKTLLGPYQPCTRNPVFTHRDIVNTTIQGTGHMDLVDDTRGNWWAVFLGFRITEHYFHHIGRETFLAPVSWATGDFPVINDGRPVQLEMDADDLPLPVSPVHRDFVDDFRHSDLHMRYNFLRASRPVPFQIDNGLLLRGNGTDLDECGTPSFIGFRQAALSCTVFCTLSAELTSRSRAGITVFYDNTRHFDLFVMGNEVQVRKRFDDFCQVSYRAKRTADTLTLMIRTDGILYQFGWGQTREEAESNVVAQGYARHLSTEAGIMSFTGVYIGMFVDEGTEDIACFQKLEYRESAILS